MTRSRGELNLEDVAGLEPDAIQSSINDASVASEASSKNIMSNLLTSDKFRTWPQRFHDVGVGDDV
jgi:hypothetical protein